MLILTRKVGDTIFVGKDIQVTVVSVKGQEVRIGIHAPPEIKVRRDDLPELPAAPPLPRSPSD